MINSIRVGTKRVAFAFTLILGLFSLGQLSAYALQNVTLAWDPSPDPTVVGYYVYYGAASGGYTNRVDAGSSTSATVPNLVQGVTYYFAVTAYNAAGLESDPSNEISYTVPLPPAVTLTAPLSGATYMAPATLNLAANVVTNGHTITQVQFFNGTTLLGTDSLPPYRFTWSSVSAGSYSLKARVTYDSGSTLDSTVNSITVTNPLPAIALATPTNNATFSAPATIPLAAIITANGHSITKVQFYIGTVLLGEAAGAPYSLAWNCTNSGLYSVKARLVFDNGSTMDSVVASINIRPAPPLNNHVVSIVGAGTVTPDLTTKSLVVGNRYTVTAVPAAGQEFAGWSGSVSSSSSTLTFVLTSNFNVRATFVPSAATAPQGNFYGLFYESNRVEQASSGAFVLSTTKRGRYSGYLQMGNAHLPFHGELDSQGQATNNLVRRNQSPLALQFNLLGGAHADQVQGSVAADTWVAGLTADRAGFSPKSNPAPLKGAYTLLLPGQESNSPALPFGHSFGLVNVDAGGRVRLTASLADGTRLTQSAPLSAHGVWGLYAPLYGGQGSVLSWLSFTNRPADDLNGALSWIKPANSKARRYAAGFTNDCQALGSIYTAPAPHTGLGWNLPNASVSFAGGDLTTDFANFLTLNANGQWNNTSSNHLSLSVSRNTGAFRGNVTDPASGKVLPFAGVLFQKTQSGYGFLLGPSQSSQVSLTQ